DAEPLCDAGAPVLDSIGFQCGLRELRLDGFGPRLHDEQLAGAALAGPLDVHRTAVMPLDRARPARKRQNLTIVQYEVLAFGSGSRNIARRLFSGPTVDEF